MESKRWGDGKKPTLSLGSTIAFGGFIDRIRRERSIDKAMLSMEIEVANIAYITNCPNTQNSPSRRYFLFRMSVKNTNITLTEADTRATTSRTRWNYNKPTKKNPLSQSQAGTSQQTMSESITQGKRKRSKLSDEGDDHTASDDSVKKKE
jgi:hypothetical protein